MKDRAAVSALVNMHAGEDGARATALTLAALNGSEASCHLLLENSADQAARNANGFTALMSAAYNGHDGVVALLLKKGGSTGINGFTLWRARNFKIMKKHIEG